jgi:SpoVK/Ycf46/Vps4 family AAA+-type ATPase
MPFDRIQRLFNTSREGRFRVLYGPGVEDTFISTDLEEMDVEHAVWQILQGQGFERIAFIAPHRPVFFLDARSETTSRPGKIQPAPEEAHPETMSHLGDGPLENLLLLKIRPLMDASNPLLEIGDAHAIRLLDAILKDDSIPSAVVFLQAEASLRFFEDQRLLAGILGEWARLPASNPNLACFVFSANRYEELCETARPLPVPELRSLILRQGEAHGQLLRLGGPEKDEIERLVHLATERFSLPCDTSNLPRLVDWMSAEGLQGRLWLSRLRDTPTLDIQSARRLGWFEASEPHEQPALERLEHLVGLQPVKDRLQELDSWLRFRREDTEPPLLHMIFSGSPGTGKTTVARLFGEALRDLGLLRRGHLVEVSSHDLVADHVGGTAIKTNAVIDRALDGILFIDEAYMLTENERGGFGREAVDALLTRMEDDRSRLVVIAAGYSHKMNAFRRANPGLPRRFPEENVLHFQDFEPGELIRILQKMLADRQLTALPPTSDRLKTLIKAQYTRRDETFGNAGEMRNLAEALDRRRALRIATGALSQDTPLDGADIPESYLDILPQALPSLDDLLTELDSLVGLGNVRQHLRRMLRRLQFEGLQAGASETVELPDFKHLVFSGSPGTGKTTIARLLGRIYHTMGLLTSGHCVEVSRPDLVAGFVGQTALKVQERVREAIGGVLFIDEAYALNRGGVNDFGREAIDVLVKVMEDQRGRLLVIVAGYPLEMKSFLSANPGLSSRFAPPIEFEDYAPAELLEILQGAAVQDGYSLSQQAAQRAMALFSADPGHSLANARSALDLLDVMKSNLAERVLDLVDTNPGMDLQDPGFSCFTLDDLPLPSLDLITHAAIPIQQSQICETAIIQAD